MTAMNAGLPLVVSAIGIASQIHQQGRQCIGLFCIPSGKILLFDNALGEQACQGVVVETIDVSPGWVLLQAGVAGGVYETDLSLNGISCFF